jgi:hypothetical protein
MKTSETIPEWRKRSRAIRVPTVCAQCSAEFQALKDSVRKGAGLFCSKECRRAHALTTGKFRGENSGTWRGGVSKDNMRYRRRQAERWPERDYARRTVNYEIRMGRLVRQPCEKCGTADRVHAHHDDYSKPLSVRWLCRTHHDEHHRLAGDKRNGASRPILERREDTGSEVLDGAAAGDERGGSRW